MASHNSANQADSVTGTSDLPEQAAAINPSDTTPTTLEAQSQTSTASDRADTSSTPFTAQPPAMSASITSATTPTTITTAAAAAPAIETQVSTTASPSQVTAHSTPIASSVPLPTAIPSATASMLPRSTSTPSTAASSNTAVSSSSSSSGTVTPVMRPNGGSIGSSSPRREAVQINRPDARNHVLSRITRHSQAQARPRRHGNASLSAAIPTAAASMASTDGSNAVPSIFGFYSHDGNPTNQSRPSSNPPVAPTRTSPLVAQPAQSSLASSRHDLHPLSFHRHWDPIEDVIVPAVEVSANPASTPTFSQRLAAHRFARLHNYHQPRHSQSSTSTSTNINASANPAELSPSHPATQPTFEETTTLSFNWTIRDLHLLREEVELSAPPSEGGRSVSAGAGKSDVWTNQPTFGDGKWKLELVRTIRPLTDRPEDVTMSAANGDQDEPMSASVGSADTVPTAEGSGPQRNSITILSVYLTALVLEYTPANVEIPASIMVGLRPTRAAVGRRGAENGGWMWRRFYDYTFQKEADLFTCHDLPSVSEMLQDTNVARDDAITLTIQLGLGPGHTRGQSGQLDDNAITRNPVEVDGHHLVPRAVLNSLHGLLDDSNTGDVRIVVRERGFLLQDMSANDSSEDGHRPISDGTDLGRVVPYPIGSSCPASSSRGWDEDGSTDPAEDDPGRIFVRDRILWAHGSVLRSRSDYFETMLASGFRESTRHSYGGTAGERHTRTVRTLRIPDADFVTAYWFLRYLYTEDIHFADKENVRSAVLDEEWAKGADQGGLTADSLGEETGIQDARASLLVDWTPISQLEDDWYYSVDESHPSSSSSSSVAYATAVRKASSSSEHRRDVSGSFVLQGSSLRNPTSTTSGSIRPRTSTGGLVPSGISSSSSSSSSSTIASGSGNTISAPASPSAAGSASSGAGIHHTIDEASRSNHRHRASSSNVTVTAACSSITADPHAHPCPEPGPASALSIFKLAHRYHMQDLSKLASVHMVATLTPQSAFPMLLATSMYTDLHARIKTYVYQHWHLVSHTHEFERCCDEVSVGMWGADAGKTMRAFVRSLVSPLRPAQT